MTQENSRSHIGIETRFGPAPALKSASITGHLDGLLLEMRVQQRYRNESGKDIEVVYSFPLAWGARLLGLDVAIAGKKLRGTVLPREEARKNYEEAVEKGDTPVMVEQSADGICTANLGNLRPGEEAVLDLRYAQLLRYEQGRLRLSVPTVIAPRYGDEHHPGALAPHETAAADISADYPLTLDIELRGDIATAATRITSPSHRIATRKMPGGRAVSVADGATLDRDFILVLDGLAGKTFALIAPDNFAATNTTAKKASAKNAAKKTASAHTLLASFCPSLPRETRKPLLLKVLVDCSGSMAGDSIRSAREALHRVLAELNPSDYVSFSRFGDKVAHESRHLENCAPATIRRIADAISRTDADLGGTEMRAALLSTFRDISAPAAKGLPPPTVLLITDGEIWETREVLDEARRSGHRIFAVGVGGSPAETLHRKLAEQTGGACELVTPNENAADAIVRMFHRLRATAAVDVQVDWGAGVKPLWQSALPRALYDGETIHVFAQFAKPPPRPPQLLWKTKGKSGAAHTLRAQTLTAVLGDSLPRLAGAKQLDEAGTDAQRKKIAMRYQLVSEQTNLFLLYVRAEKDKAGSLPTLHQVPQMLAAAWGGMGTVRDSEIMCSRGRTEIVCDQEPVIRPALVYCKSPVCCDRAYAPAPADMNDKIRALIRQAREQGCLTYDDISEALPESVDNQEDIENVLAILDSLDIEVIEVDQIEEFKQQKENATRKAQTTRRKPAPFTLDKAVKEPHAMLRNTLVHNFSLSALLGFNFKGIVAKLAAIAGAGTVSRVAAIARQTSASEEDVWAVLLDYLTQSSAKSRLTTGYHAKRILRERLKTIPPKTRQAIIASRDFASLCASA